MVRTLQWRIECWKKYKWRIWAGIWGITVERWDLRWETLKSNGEEKETTNMIKPWRFKGENAAENKPVAQNEQIPRSTWISAQIA